MSNTSDIRTRANAGGVRSGADKAALSDLLRSGMPEDHILAWAELGPLTYARQLDNAGFPLHVAQQFPRTPLLLKQLALGIGQAKNLGMSWDDLIHWHAAGVFILKRPFYNSALWARWRAAGIHNLGLHNAALAAAAGITPEEAALLMRNNEWDKTTIELMAAVRHASR